ncbi:hypothetical protein SLEP1_g53478 [Rubroshorea leprosula]|uniref:Uncharacterized protein n=1 Tax=Rubroshorea leprosula TaxID=152421 RepID=A0AAV5MCB4_9ROSI|nr:hypothetical protein SLEP1_g53478 [Rubroshorea leprosula]
MLIRTFFSHLTIDHLTGHRKIYSALRGEDCNMGLGAKYDVLEQCFFLSSNPVAAPCHQHACLAYHQHQLAHR